MNIQHSPVDKLIECTVVKQYDTSKITRLYKETLQLDISRYIIADKLTLYRCERTKLEFYRGINPGSGEFYEKLMNFDWYYDPWKWEHQRILEKLLPSDTILEIGCGSGGFLKRLESKGFETEGLELNEKALKTCQAQNLNVSNKSLKDLISNKNKRFDWVVTFQVAEHIEKIGDFLKEAASLLKPDGKLVVCVPNNDSFIKLDDSNVLNMPPHHMNLFNETSLRNIASIIDCKVEEILIEPLQQYHYNWYTNLHIQSADRSVITKIPFIRRFHFSNMKSTMLNWLTIEGKNIVGHSIMAIYTKDKK